MFFGGIAFAGDGLELLDEISDAEIDETLLPLIEGTDEEHVETVLLSLVGWVFEVDIAKVMLIEHKFEHELADVGILVTTEHTPGVILGDFAERLLSHGGDFLLEFCLLSFDFGGRCSGFGDFVVTILAHSIAFEIDIFGALFEMTLEIGTQGMEEMEHTAEDLDREGHIGVGEFLLDIVEDVEGDDGAIRVVGVCLIAAHGEESITEAILYDGAFEGIEGVLYVIDLGRGLSGGEGWLRAYCGGGSGSGSR